MKILVFAITAIVLIVAGFMYYEKTADAHSKARLAMLEAERQEMVLRALSQEQRVEVTEYFRRAVGFYGDGRPDLCLAALKDMRRFIHVYKSSNDLEIQCQKALSEKAANAQAKGN